MIVYLDYVKTIYLIRHSAPFIEIENYDNNDEILWSEFNRNMILSPKGEENARKLCEVDELKSNQTFELELTRDECELIVDALKPWEEELGWDVTLLIEKIEMYKHILPKGEGVVECVEID